MGEAGLVRAEGTVVTTIANNDLILFQKVSSTPSGQPEPREIAYGNLITGGGTGLASTTVPYVNASGDFASDSANFFYTVGSGTLTARILNAGQSTGIAGEVSIWPSTTSMGRLKIVSANNSGSFITTITNAAQGGAHTYTIPDAGASASFVMTGGNQTLTGTTTLNALSVGSNGSIGTFSMYPGNASNGIFFITPVNNTGNFNTTISNSNVGQSTVYSLPDPGASTANILLDTGNISVAGNKTFTGTTQANTLNIGASGTVGSLSLFSTTASKGSWNFAPVDNTGNTVMTITNAAQGGAHTYTIPDAGASASFVMTAGAQTIAGVKTFSSVPIGIQEVVQVNLATITGLAGAVTSIFSAPFAGTVTAISAAVNAAFATSNIVITPSVYHSGTPTAITSGAVTITQSGSAAGTTGTATPSAANTFVVGDMISATITGGTGTVGGIITLLVTRTA